MTPLQRGFTFLELFSSLPECDEEVSLLCYFSFPESFTIDVDFGTYQAGSNPYWFLKSSSNSSAHPLPDVLKGSNAGDAFDNYGSVDRNDPSPQITLVLRGAGKNKLFFVKGQFTSRFNNQNVTVRFLDGTNLKKETVSFLIC